MEAITLMQQQVDAAIQSMKQELVSCGNQSIWKAVRARETNPPRSQKAYGEQFRTALLAELKACALRHCDAIRTAACQEIYTRMEPKLQLAGLRNVVGHNVGRVRPYHTGGSDDERSPVGVGVNAAVGGSTGVSAGLLASGLTGQAAEVSRTRARKASAPPDTYPG